ncbi:RNA pyrophosphohydrolase [uncultured archaeon]|nr:RNA pyrophosphohydrolase [uncultured archaeon]
MRDAKASKNGWRKASASDVNFLRIETKKIGRPDGTTKILERVRHDGAAVIVPITASGEVIMLRQYRPAVDAWLYELPAGTIEKGEKPVDCGARELKEETGFSANEVKEIFSSYSSPGWSTEKHYFILARGLTKGKQRLDADEKIGGEQFTTRHLQEMINDGRIVDGKTIQGICFYLQNRSRL